MNKHPSLIELRWPTLATLALCTWLPGCPMTDNYFIDPTAGGSAQMSNGGAPSLSGGSSSVAGGPSNGGSTAGGPEVHPDHMGPDPLGGGGTGAGTGTPDAGSSDAGSSDVAGASTGLGGSGGNGGMSVTAGSSAAGSSPGGSSFGGSGSAGEPSNLPQPACDDGVAKGDYCGPSSPSPCYKSCGPDNLGSKPLTCQGSVYDEPIQGCNFPAGHDYSCYRVPTSLPAECPSGTPRGGRSCQIAACTVCFGGTTWAPQYQDSTGAVKNGYCVCSNAGVWTCASNNGSWPCPDGAGCH